MLALLWDDELRSAIHWAALFTAWPLFSCGGNSYDAPNAHGDSGGAAGGASGGDSPVEPVHGGQGGEGPIIEGGSGGGTQPNFESLIASAWDIKLSAIWVDPDDNRALPPGFNFTLALMDDASSGFTGIVSSPGDATRLTLTRQSGATATISAADSKVRVALSSAAPFTAVQINTLTLTALDDDHDGVADRLIGGGDGEIEVSCGDCSYGVAVTLALSGTPDRTRPRLKLPSEAQNPIDPLALVVSEALQSGMLSLSGRSNVALTSKNDVLLRFSSDEVLPFAGAWKVVGAAQDFAGNALDLKTASLTTIEDPGIFAQDGFESKPNALLTGGAVLVDASSGLPIPNGQQALLLPPGSSATFHLERATASAVLSASFVDLAQADGGGPWSSFVAAVIGGTERVGTPLQYVATSGPTMHATWKLATAPRTAQTVLKEAGSDVIVRISAETCAGDGLCPPLGALLVDDLKLE